MIEIGKKYRLKKLELMSESTSLLFLLLIVFLYWLSALHLLKRTEIS